MMKNFTFHNPTKLIFGKGCLSELRAQIPKEARILITYGGGSVVRNGILQQVEDYLEGYTVFEFGGIESNPDCATLDKAIAYGRSCDCTYLVAVGGGSVLDGTKLIAAGIKTTDASAWEMVQQKRYTAALPYGTVLTVPATGSEMNRGSVISNRATGEKFSFYSEFPIFSLLDPTFTYTLSEHQVACGIADIFVHTLEQYLTYPGQSGVMDRLAEGLLLNILDFAPLRLESPQDYDVACEYMLSATIGLNGFLSMGVDEDWSTHAIGHELTALAGTTHGASLVMILPALLEVMRPEKEQKVLQMGRRVFGLKHPTFRDVVEKVKDFIHSLGLSTSIKEEGISPEVVLEIDRRFSKRGKSYGERGIVTPDKISQILRLSSEL